MKAPAEKILPIGSIAQVHGPVVDIDCAALPPLHQALVSQLNHETSAFSYRKS